MGQRADNSFKRQAIEAARSAVNLVAATLVLVRQCIYKIDQYKKD